MFSQSLIDSLNTELTRERTAVATYIAMTGLFQYRNLLGFQAWGMKNSHEESEHAKAFFDYLDRLLDVLLDAGEAARQLRAKREALQAGAHDKVADGRSGQVDPERGRPRAEPEGQL